GLRIGGQALLDRVEQRALEREDEGRRLRGAEALEHAVARQVLEEVAGVVPLGPLQAGNVGAAESGGEGLPEPAHLRVELERRSTPVLRGPGEAGGPGVEDGVLAGLDEGERTRVESGHAGIL